MDWRTFLDCGLALLAAYLGYRNYVMETRKESQRESSEMTEVRVQLNQVMSLLHDMQKDIRSSTADFRALDKRVTIAETKLAEAFTRLEKMEEQNGKQ